MRSVQDLLLQLGN